VDVAFRLRCDRWQGEERLQLEVVGIRPGGAEEVMLQRGERTYRCRREADRLVIVNGAGEAFTAPLPGPAAPAAGEATHPYLQSLVQEAAVALGMAL
jgi:single-stranded-DNA-specific exonuclease